MLDAFRWGYTFLLADGRLTAAERSYLLGEATKMYLVNEEERAVRLDSLEGRLYTKGQYDSLGHFGGQRFDAELDTSRGKVKLRFLVSEQSGEEQKSGYVN